MNKFQKLLNKKNKSKIICLTAYSKNFAEILDNHCDIILVGDSLGSVLYNLNSTKGVSLEMMIQHAKSVKMGIKKSMMIVDMPYNTYRNKKEALINAKKIIKSTKCDAVKMEGGTKIKDITQHLIKNKIPLMGHLGLLPQTAGKFRFQGKNKSEKNKLLKEAKLLESLGVFSMILECVETSTAKEITKSIKIPTIGIGSSVHCDGQVLVTDDLLGLNETNIRFVKKFANIKSVIKNGLKKFKKEVTNKNYPSKKYSY